MIEDLNEIAGRVLLDPYGVDDASILKLLESPRCPPEVFRSIWLERRGSFELYLVSNPVCPADILEQMSKSESSSLLEMVATNPNTPLEILHKLSNSDRDFIRSAVARNPSTPSGILRKLGGDKFSILYDISGNSNADEYTLRKLSKLEWTSLKLRVILNPSTPIELLIELSKDPLNLISDAAKRSPRFPEDLAEWSLGLEDW